jgi:hypothetical protein
MVQQAIAPRALVNFAERKWRELISLICSGARRHIYSITDQVITFDGSTQTGFSKSFKTAFFQGEGDALDVYMAGRLQIAAGGAATFYVPIFGDTGSIDSNNFMLFPFTAGGGGGVTADFVAHGRIFLGADKNFMGNSIVKSAQMTNSLRVSRLPGATFDETEFGLELKAVGDVGGSLTVDLFQVEFVPAVAA